MTPEAAKRIEQGAKRLAHGAKRGPQAQSAKRIEQGAKRKGQRAKRMATERPKFRFMDLEIWRDSIEIAEKLFDLADKLEARRFYRFAEQLRGSGLSMSNNPVK